eukprot:GHRQ01026182.1.p3 GENE.GHRQ01026182.1~~GHRQ01026182.1.p3  ORF type:complete len:100 (+),score=21.78 GHRQ01026182.1:185-484(+)
MYTANATDLNCAAAAANQPTVAHLAHCKQALNHVLAAPVNGALVQNGPEALKHAVQPSRRHVLQVRANLQQRRVADSGWQHNHWTVQRMTSVCSAGRAM